MNIKILGTGCPGCRKLEQNTINALSGLGIKAVVEKETDIKEILNYGVMKLPAVVIDGEVKLSGKVASVDELKKLILENS